MQIELLAPLHHPNIVEFLGIVKAKPTYYILTGKRIHVCVLVGGVILASISIANYTVFTV